MASPTDDWQATIRELFTIGRGTDYPGIGGVTGTGIEPFSFVGNRAGVGLGVVFGTDRVGPRRLRFPVRVIGDSESDVYGNLRVLASAWRPAAGSDEVTLDVRWPGMVETVMRCYGHPGEVSPNLADMKGGVIDCTVDFYAAPLWYGAEQSAASAASAYDIPASATGETGADTDRVTITLTGNGSTPTVTHSPSGGTVIFSQALAVGESAVIDLHTRTVTVNGSNADSRVSSASTWFRFTGGADNTVTVTGAASQSITHRPAHWSP